MYGKITMIIDLPEKCNECPFESNQSYCCFVDAETIAFRNKGIHKNCPIEPYELGDENESTC